MARRRAQIQRAARAAEAQAGAAVVPEAQRALTPPLDREAPPREDRPFLVHPAAPQNGGKLDQLLKFAFYLLDFCFQPI